MDVTQILRWGLMAMAAVRFGAPSRTLPNGEEAADRIGMSVRYVRRLIAERRIVFYRIGRSIRIDPADLAALVESSRVEPTTSVAEERLFRASGSNTSTS